ncbi:hypothetical protein E2C01_095772 [Portunus trituberculatus]|uniref:Uncharacterized protein n=1 Tax=Portunus trituberculatus TaxID=210409 RepID=A0A5B7K538_PORTR|nr:hypothetical protein [Portunus trituberculatus]
MHFKNKGRMKLLGNTDIAFHVSVWSSYQPAVSIKRLLCEESRHGQPNKRQAGEDVHETGRPGAKEYCPFVRVDKNGTEY